MKLRRACFKQDFSPNDTMHIEQMDNCGVEIVVSNRDLACEFPISIDHS